MPSTIIYLSNFSELDSFSFNDFFVGWHQKPATESLRKLLCRQSHKVVAIDSSKKQIVGFIYAITDGVLAAYIPLIEVSPAYQQQGIGKKLMEILLQSLADIYMIDLCCDEELITYYQAIGFQKSRGMIKRNYNCLKKL